jgi:cell division protein FtsL
MCKYNFCPLFDTFSILSIGLFSKCREKYDYMYTEKGRILTYRGPNKPCQVCKVKNIRKSKYLTYLRIIIIIIIIIVIIIYEEMNAYG